MDTHLKLIKWLKAILHMLEVEWADLKVALKKYDVIATQVNHNYKTNLGKQLISSIPDNNYIHVIEGPQINEFDEETIAKFVNSDFKISDQSDRMGYRLKGNTVAPKNSADIISEPVALGSIQVPNDGNF